MTENELYHFGVKGMRWGVRRNRSLSKERPKKASSNKSEAQARRQKIKKAAIIGTAVVGTTLAAYGAYKASKYLKEKAGKLSYESGKKYANEHFFNKMKNSTVSYDWRDRENYNALYQAGKQTLQNTDKRTKRVSGSTIEAIKYLRHPESYLVDGSLLKLY